MTIIYKVIGASRLILAWMAFFGQDTIGTTWRM